MKAISSKEYFDEVAHEWDRMRESLYSEAVRERAFEAAGVRKGKVAADIGAGSGFVTEGLIRQGVKVIAVDQSEAMLAEMRRKFAGVEGIDYRLGEAGRLPIEDEAVDYVFANMYLHHVESPPAAIKEMARTLRPGGRLVITDMEEHNFNFLRKEQHDRWLGFKIEDVRNWFEEAGLKNVAVEGSGECCCAEASNEDEVAEVSIFVARGEK